MTRLARTATSIAILLACSQSYAYKLPGHFLFEAGAYTTSPGESQHVPISGLIGDNYSVTNRHDGAPIFGVGYLIDGFKRDRFGIDYGINAYYLAKTKVSGTITQENVFTNLAYQYYVSHLPIYAIAKGYFNTQYHDLAVTLNLGIGPNFLDISGFQDRSLDGGTTQPDNAFSGHTNVVLSGMAGIGVKGNIGGQVPVELAYQYFYLGSSSLNPRSNQIQNKLNTGNVNAQALILTVSI